jgi:hypothetical protein
MGQQSQLVVKYIGFIVGRGIPEHSRIIAIILKGFFLQQNLFPTIGFIFFTPSASKSLQSKS